MEIIYLYCAFSYLFMLGAYVNTGDFSDLNKRESWVAFFVFALSPITFPFWSGYELNNIATK